LEKELTNCKKDLSEREKRLDDAQQAQATMQSEFNKQKQELEKNKKIHYTLNMTKRKYEKEKDELSKQNQSLAKQLEEAKEEGNYFIFNPVG
jgi:nucleoprotein TPR/epidermal growth factor receptor substrate 15